MAAHPSTVEIAEAARYLEALKQYLLDAMTHGFPVRWTRHVGPDIRFRLVIDVDPVTINPPEFP